MALSAYERETVIVMNDEEDTAQVTSCQRTVWTRMEKLGVQPDKEVSMDGRIIQKVFTIPKSWVKIGRPKRVEMTDEQRQQKSARMRALREEQLAGSR